MSDQPNYPFGFGQAIKVHAEAVVIRNGQPVQDEDTAPTTVQED